MSGRNVRTVYRWSDSDAIAYDASAQSAAVSAHIHQVRIVTTGAAWVAIGTNPTAVADTDDNHFLAAGVPEIITVSPGQKLAFIKATGAAAGVACVTELTG
jgi:hypothetical protein